MATSPCGAAGHDGAWPSVCRCGTASTEPDETATARMTKAATSMTKHSTALTLSADFSDDRCRVEEARQ